MDSSSSVRPNRTKRRKVVAMNGQRPNPLFEKWLTEWKEEAERKQLKTKFVYDRALKSLSKYPLTLKTGREAKILEFFGDKICQMLDDKLVQHRSENGQTIFAEERADEPSEKKKEDAKRKKRKHDGEERDEVRQTDKKTTMEYVPAFRSGPYALLMALFKAKQENNIGFMNKTTLVDAAQPLCEKSFKVPEPGSYYTAWSSMGTLIKKCLVVKEGNPARYGLTESGFDLVAQMMNVVEPKTLSAVPPLPFSVVVTSSSSRGTRKMMESEDDKETLVSTQNVNVVRGFKLLPGQFEIILCVDNCETVSGGLNARKQQVQSELRRNGISFDVRKLHVGDFIWIAREKVLPIPGQLHLPDARELVLDYIIERKRKDDLASSILDGRFREQKSRMKSCSLRNPIYLIEECGSNNHFAIPELTLLQAITNTQVVDGFAIKETQNLAESVAYLTIMTRYLQSIYSGKTLFSRTTEDDEAGERTALLTFDEFNRNSMKMKPLSISELFFKQLLQLNGISVDRGKAIIELYPTPLSLMQKYRECSEARQRENVFSFVTSKSGGRNLGPTLSKALSHFYTETELR